MGVVSGGLSLSLVLFQTRLLIMNGIFAYHQFRQHQRALAFLIFGVLRLPFFSVTVETSNAIPRRLKQSTR
jgi:1-acyl-sn-glycerol-3-phosphate acyltransferase